MISYTTAAFLCLGSLWIGGAVGVFCMCLVCVGKAAPDRRLDAEAIDLMRIDP